METNRLIFLACLSKYLYFKQSSNFVRLASRRNNIPEKIIDIAFVL